MSTPNFSPRYIPAKVTFQMGSEVHSIGEHLINETGVPAFSWSFFDPLGVVGKRCLVKFSLLTQSPLEFETEALLTCEQTSRAATMGLAFNLPEQDAAILRGIIEKDGVLPEFARKLPRIPFNERVSVMPSRAILFLSLGGRTVPVAAEVDNLSPIGIQVFTEDMRSESLIPGAKIQVELQPRGGNLEPILINSEVKRIIYSVNPISGNSRCCFGLGITAVADVEKKKFANLLRLIVQALKKLSVPEAKPASTHSIKP